MMNTGERLRRQGEVSLAYRLLYGEALGMVTNLAPDADTELLEAIMEHQSGFGRRLQAALEYFGWELRYGEHIPTSQLDNRISMPQRVAKAQSQRSHWGAGH